MHFTALALPGVWLVRQTPREDPRGHFARTFCADQFAGRGLPSVFPQCNVALNARAGTLRGMHWQADPHPEGKLVRCSRGAMFDVAIDIRRGSASFGRWVGATLTEANGDALYIPPGFAHGFQTLRDATEVFYMMTVPYRDGLARGLCWNDPAVVVDWPLPDPTLSDRDAALPGLAEIEPLS